MPSSVPRTFAPALSPTYPVDSGICPILQVFRPTPFGLPLDPDMKAWPFTPAMHLPRIFRKRQYHRTMAWKSGRGLVSIPWRGQPFTHTSESHSTTNHSAETRIVDDGLSDRRAKRHYSLGQATSCPVLTSCRRKELTLPVYRATTGTGMPAYWTAVDFSVKVLHPRPVVRAELQLLEYEGLKYCAV